MLRRFLAGTALTLACLLGATASVAAKPGDHYKLDRKLNDRAATGGSHTSRVIVTLKPGWDGYADYKKVGGKLGRRLNLINGQVVELTNNQLRKLADSPAVESIHWDRPTGGEMNRAAVAVGARAVQEQMGFDGAGVGVAIIDSGITPWHDDLSYLGANPSVRVVGGQRVVKFVDLVNGRTTPYDDNGHGTHVAGIVAGNGYDTAGARAGIAPAAHLVSLKVLDSHGGGCISDVIAALDWVVQYKSIYNLRVVNLSVGARVTESYNTDPLTLAAKRVVDAGVVVVTAAGNLGKNPSGKLQYGAITAPGNAPWVLTVGAYSHQGTVTRVDDVMEDYSSRGPTAIDYAAKPDVVAPGTGIVSLAAQGSLMYWTKASYLLNGSVATAYKPYLSLTGTSMAAPIVAGTAALMIQANPKLTPNLVKAIIQYTAQDYGYDSLSQGAGFLNTRGAVLLSRFYATAKPGQVMPRQLPWSKTILWGNRKLKGGVIKPNGSAWATNVVWGTSQTVTGQNIVWGTLARDGDNIVWGTSLLDAANVVWGTMSSAQGENIVWGTTRDGENIVWGTMRDADNIVWGTVCGGANCENIVWGTALRDLDNIVWGTQLDADNIVWGTSGLVNNIVWGTSSEADNVTWGCSGEETPPFDDPDVPAVFDGTSFDSLFPPEMAPVPVSTDPGGSIMTTTTTVIGATTAVIGGVL
jgi:serine protease AprX